MYGAGHLVPFFSARAGDVGGVGRGDRRKPRGKPKGFWKPWLSSGAEFVLTKQPWGALLCP